MNKEKILYEEISCCHEQDKVDKKRLFELIDDLGKDLRAKAVLKDAIEDLISTVAVTDKELLEASKDNFSLKFDLFSRWAQQNNWNYYPYPPTWIHDISDEEKTTEDLCKEYMDHQNEKED